MNRYERHLDTRPEPVQRLTEKEMAEGFNALLEYKRIAEHARHLAAHEAALDETYDRIRLDREALRASRASQRAAAQGMDRRYAGTIRLGVYEVHVVLQEYNGQPTVYVQSTMRTR